MKREKEHMLNQPGISIVDFASIADSARTGR
jgi:hypothetical protein